MTMKEINPRPQVAKPWHRGDTPPPHGHNPNGILHANEDTYRRRARVLELRRTGMLWVDIAKELGLSVGYVFKIYKQALRDIVIEDVAGVRKLELQRLDALQREVTRVLNSFTPMINQGRVVYTHLEDESGNPILDEHGDPVRIQLEDVGPKLKAVQVALGVMERRSKLLGLDAPAKQELSGPNGGPIPTQNNAPAPQMTLEQLREEAARRGLPQIIFAQ